MNAIRSQKSTLWLWTTLWVTAAIDGFLIFIAFTILSRALQLQLSSIVTTGLGLFSYAIGDWLAARYVVNHSIVLKTRASQLAFYATLVPTIGSSVVLLFAIAKGMTPGHEIDPMVLGSRVASIVLGFVLTYAIVRSYILAKGD